jgi:ABC-type antimicrobial peptide transport system permease subunit
MFVQRFLGGRSAVGRVITTSMTQQAPSAAPDTRLTVVGVIGDVKNDGLRNAPAPQLIALDRLAPRFNFGFKNFLVRSRGDPSAVIAALRGELRALDAELPLAAVATVDEAMRNQAGDVRFTGGFVAAFAAVALALAIVGIYGVVSYSTSQRTPEFGVRLALGALPRDIALMVVRDGARLALLGVLLGVAGSFVTHRLIDGLLFQVAATDPVIIWSVVAAVLTAAIVASLLPAVRAMRVQPVETLKAS